MKVRNKSFSRELIKSFLPDNPVIVEAGAHIGRDTLKMSTLWPQSTIHAFEPVPKLFEQLKKNVTDNPNIFCYQLALSNETGTAPLYTSDEQCTAISSLLKPAEITQEKPEILFTPQTVQTVTLDDWAEKYAIDHIDFLWLDMQGAELQALHAAPKILKTVKAILIEVTLTERYKNNPLYDEVKAWLEKQGFAVEVEHFHHKNWGNVLFVRPNSLRIT